LQSDNYTDALRAAGLRNPASLIKIWDLNGSFGGPLQRDRLWYFSHPRYAGNRKYISRGCTTTPNAGTNKLDLRRPTRHVPPSATPPGRTPAFGHLSGNQRNKLNLFWDEQRTCIACFRRRQRDDVAEAADGTTHHGLHPGAFGDVDLADDQPAAVRAGWGFGGFLYGRERDGNNRLLPRITVQAGAIPGLTFGSMIWQRNQSFTRSTAARCRTSPARTTSRSGSTA
jgi:hypothetical protein